MRTSVFKNLCLLAALFPLFLFGQVTATFTVDMPKNRLYIDAGQNRHFEADKSLTLGGDPSAFGGSGEYSYEWSPASALDDPYSANPQVIKLHQTTYFKLRVRDLKTGCSLEEDVVVYVNTKKSKIEEVEIELFPNPFKEIVQIRSDEGIDHLTVLDLTGRVVLQKEFDEEVNATLQTEAFNSGIYLFQFKLTNGTTKNLKLCKAE